MNSDEATDPAWLAFEQGRLDDAERLWSELIAAAESEEQRNDHIGHRAYVFVAQGRFDDARAAYRDLLERTGSHRHLHQLGMVERAAGRLEEALRIFDREASLLPEGDTLAHGANLYERALLHHLLGKPEASLDLMEECVAAAESCGDPTMIGAAQRLRGDLFASRDPLRAREAYQRAIEGFQQAQDEFGIEEVEQRIAALSAKGKG